MFIDLVVNMHFSSASAVHTGVVSTNKIIPAPLTKYKARVSGGNVNILTEVYILMLFFVESAFKWYRLYT